ncbi:MAG: aminopeptidase P N-terminal domain-containing protein [Bryobacterales bacterium]|nr:aminopeptidase P N-terminal domain-containing protein [Bryobacterales bacterium]
MGSRVLAAVAAFAVSVDISASEHAARRAALRKQLPPQAVVALVGGTEGDHGDLRSTFFQEPNFLYFTGWREPEARAIFTAAGDYLFLPKRTDVRDRYTGRKAAPDDAGIAARTGFAHVLDAAEFAAKLKELAGEDRPVHWLAKSPGAGIVRETLGEARTLHALEMPAARVRMVKSAAEIARIQRSVDATIDAHRAAWKRAKSGLYEYQVAATMASAYFEQGCERHAYLPIVASGPNAIVLHYGANKRRMDAGELLLMDVGAECADYAADITRTIPVNGRFTPRQREIYEIVLGAQKAAIAAARPGMRFMGREPGTLNRVALDYVDSHGKDLHGEPLGKYYLHGLGHHVGLEVHDATDAGLTLAPGMVITIEPGVYIAEENIGVRIEDVVLITETGARVLSSSLPREAADIERALRAR